MEKQSKQTQTSFTASVFSQNNYLISLTGSSL